MGISGLATSSPNLYFFFESRTPDTLPSQTRSVPDGSGPWSVPNGCKPTPKTSPKHGTLQAGLDGPGGVSILETPLLLAAGSAGMLTANSNEILGD